MKVPGGELKAGHQLHPLARRIGRTRTWPATAGFVRYRNKKGGLTVRIGDNMWWFCYIPREERDR